MEKTARIYVSGHRGMVGSAISRALRREGYVNLIEATREELDLRDRGAVDAFLVKSKPEVVIIAAAKVGGIHANSAYPAEFLYDNLAIAQNLVDGAYQAGVPRVLFLGSSCIYPRECPQPIKEEYLLSGPLEQTNEAYAVAKIAGLKLCQHYRSQYGVLYHSLMPTNLYGPGDNYHPEHSHVLPALLRRVHEAKKSGAEQVTIWGTGKPRRELMHVEDLADAVLHVLNLGDEVPDVLNVGTASDTSILELVELIASTVGYQGEIERDLEKPDGTPQKLLCTDLINGLGWKAKIELRDGIERTYRDFLENVAVLREC